MQGLFLSGKPYASDRATDGSEAAKLDVGVRGSEEAMAILSLSLYNLVTDKNNCWGSC